ncbi:hypothetical protein [Arthrobacter sp. HLT1-20]
MPSTAATLTTPDRGPSSKKQHRRTNPLAALLLAGALIAGSALSAQAGASITPESGGIGGGTTVSGSAAIDNFVQTSATGSQTVALAADGSLWAWGDNFYGQLGDGTQDSRSEPVRVVANWPAGVVMKSVSSGNYHSVALASDGSVWSWGGKRIRAVGRRQ